MLDILYPEINWLSWSDPEATPHWRIVSAGRWHEIKLLHSDANPTLVGATFEEIGRDRGVDPYDVVLDLLLEEGENLNYLKWTSHTFSDDDIRLCLQQPDCARWPAARPNRVAKWLRLGGTLPW